LSPVAVAVLLLLVDCCLSLLLLLLLPVDCFLLDIIHFAVLCSLSPFMTVQLSTLPLLPLSLPVDITAFCNLQLIVATTVSY